MKSALDRRDTTHDGARRTAPSPACLKRAFAIHADRLPPSELDRLDRQRSPGAGRSGSRDRLTRRARPAVAAPRQRIVVHHPDACFFLSFPRRARGTPGEAGSDRAAGLPGYRNRESEPRAGGRGLRGRERDADVRGGRDPLAQRFGPNQSDAAITPPTRRTASGRGPRAGRCSRERLYCPGSCARYLLTVLDPMGCVLFC